MLILEGASQAILKQIQIGDPALFNYSILLTCSLCSVIQNIDNIRKANIVQVAFD